MIISLPWPPMELWPNAGRVHDAAKTRAKRKAKSDAGWATIEARSKRGRFIHDGKPIPIKLFVYPKPRGPHPDADNCVAACKWSLDAIAHEIGVNDRDFQSPQVFFMASREGRMEVHVG